MLLNGCTKVVTIPDSKALKLENSYTSKLDECQNDARKVWNVICSTFLHSKLIKETSDLLVTNNGTILDYQNIANKFNEFCSIGSNLANNFSNTFLKFSLPF